MWLQCTVQVTLVKGKNNMVAEGNRSFSKPNISRKYVLSRSNFENKTLNTPYTKYALVTIKWNRREFIQVSSNQSTKGKISWKIDTAVADALKVVIQLLHYNNKIVPIERAGIFQLKR